MPPPGVFFICFGNFFDRGTSVTHVDVLLYFFRSFARTHHPMMAPMPGLTDQQLQIVIDGAYGLPLDKRSPYLQRVWARLTLHGGRHVTDDDVTRAVQQALRGLVHQQPAA